MADDRPIKLVDFRGWVSQEEISDRLKEHDLIAVVPITIIFAAHKDAVSSPGDIESIATGRNPPKVFTSRPEDIAVVQYIFQRAFYREGHYEG